MNKSNDSCWKWILILEFYCCDILEGKDMSGVCHGNVVSRPCIQCLVSRAELESMERKTRQDIEGSSRATEKEKYIIFH